MEIRLLRVLLFNVNNVMNTAEKSGRNKIHQAKFICSNLISENLQSFIEVKSSTCADWRLR